MATINWQSPRIRRGYPQLALMDLRGHDRLPVEEYRGRGYALAMVSARDDDPAAAAEIRSATLGTTYPLLTWRDVPSDWESHPRGTFARELGAAVNLAGLWAVDPRGEPISAWPGTISPDVSAEQYGAVWASAAQSWVRDNAGGFSAVMIDAMVEDVSAHRLDDPPTYRGTFRSARGRANIEHAIRSMLSTGCGVLVNGPFAEPGVANLLELVAEDNAAKGMARVIESAGLGTTFVVHGREPLADFTVALSLMFDTAIACVTMACMTEWPSTVYSYNPWPSLADVEAGQPVGPFFLGRYEGEWIREFRTPGGERRVVVADWSSRTGRIEA